MIYVNFGEYIKSKRIKMGLSQTKAAKMFGISLSYLSGIERNLRPAPTDDVVAKIADVFELSRKERYRLYDLAAESKQPPALADDLVTYIYRYPMIRDMLRYSMECNMKETDWDNVFDYVKKNYFY